jgi:hypothetical protein
MTNATEGYTDSERAEMRSEYERAYQLARSEGEDMDDAHIYACRVSGIPDDGIV